MSKLYGTITNERCKKSTRCANWIVTAAAQSFEGSIVVSIEIGSNGNHYATIGIAPNSADSAATILWQGRLSFLTRAKEIRLDTQHQLKPRKEDSNNAKTIKETTSSTIAPKATTNVVGSGVPLGWSEIEAD